MPLHATTIERSLMQLPDLILKPKTQQLTDFLLLQCCESNCHSSLITCEVCWLVFAGEQWALQVLIPHSHSPVTNTQEVLGEEGVPAGTSTQGKGMVQGFQYAYVAERLHYHFFSFQTTNSFPVSYCCSC
eukprot:GHRR01032507.1.p1 GENE.GHRR01032507.1~~GHRR01032507.1.p1  ORF type:complete len:130 (+),score=15.57 GHRR01032507.1:307-696(+)